MSDSASCIFCGIAEGKIPADLIYEDDAVVAFMDVAPATVGHALVIPRRHVSDIWDVDDETLSEVMRAARRVAHAARAALEPDGLRIQQASGAAAGQTVFHFHVHVIPRYVDDAVQNRWGAPGWSPPEADRSEIAAKIRAQL